MSPLRLPIAVIMTLAMMIGAYVLPQRTGRGLSSTLTASLGSCPDQAPAEDGLASNPSSPEPSPEAGGAWNLSVSSEEETDGDEFLLSEQELSHASLVYERSVLTALAHDSHITDLSRRPPRVSIA